MTIYALCLFVALEFTAIYDNLHTIGVSALICLWMLLLHCYYYYYDLFVIWRIAAVPVYAVGSLHY